MHTNQKLTLKVRETSIYKKLLAQRQKSNEQQENAYEIQLDTRPKAVESDLSTVPHVEKSRAPERND